MDEMIQKAAVEVMTFMEQGKERMRQFLADFQAHKAQGQLPLGVQPAPVLPGPVPTPAQPSPVPQDQAPADPVNLKARRPLAWGQHVLRLLGPTEGEKFLQGVCWIEDELHVDANNLMACMAFETGRAFRSNTRNPHSSATGLIQFMDSTAHSLGTTTVLLAAMDEVHQLSYVYRYFKAAIAVHGVPVDLPDTYMAILWPAAMGKPLSYAMFVQGSQSYAVNAGLDADFDHVVTKAEAAARVMAQLALGLEEENVG